MDENDEGVSDESSSGQLQLGLSFFVFGLINNVLYVIILSAALDLVPPSTPKGIVAFCNIAPALVAKVGWPYVLKGRIRYGRRLVGCCGISVCGMATVALFESLWMRLLGIALASFSSGLGELTFLQLSTAYPASLSGNSVGYFASGTGAAGLVGAFLWWQVRALGVKTGVGISAILPAIIPLTYFLLLPHPSSFNPLPRPSSSAAYVPLPAFETDHEPAQPEAEDVLLTTKPAATFALSLQDKWALVRPLLGRYMLPLFFVYTLEYTINQGIGPTLVYPVPSPVEYPILGSIIKSVRDYYPLWQLVYQTSVFASRSSISLGVPPLPANLLSLPAYIQLAVLVLLGVESAWGIFDSVDEQGKEAGEAWSVFVVFVLISVEGICGGLAYVNVFYRLSYHVSNPTDGDEHPERSKQEREFTIGSVGFADSLGILTASILAVPAEVGLCRAQVRRGRELCVGL